MKKPFFIILIYFTFNLSFSQGSFVPGYLIRLAGDTIEGEIKINPKKMHEVYTKLIYKGDRGTQETYKPDEVKGYGFKDNNFVTNKLNEEFFFYKVLCNGKIMFYEVMYAEAFNKDKFTSDYYISKKGDVLFERAKQGKIKKQLSDYMKTNPAALDGFDDSKFDAAKVIAVIDKFNKM